ncbi:OmpA family protein [Mucilaginibacter terrenus]|uniref:OmpA family protein n=1 Tax=Mucilaginibacter terrenus TaxID=2482727 RepID=A0A3E2NUA0_9SPHI|nr:OmpA family protein [Mucilaginibacter terrenus]RFZ84501.1 OmpA family protein [Mucilaginibacter terrenus]
MKPTLKKASVLFTSLLVGGRLLAQTPDSISTKDYVKPFSGGGAFRTWSIGINGGVLTPFTIFGTNGRQDFRTPQAEIGYGAYIKKQILPSFAIQADYLGGKVKGKDAQPNVNGYNSFETKMHWSAALSGNLTLANINWRHQKGVIQPYVTFGGGIMSYKPVLTTTAGTSTEYKTNGNIEEFFIPLGAGLKFNLGSGVNLDLGYQVNFVSSDNFDGYNYGSGNDRFSYAHIGLEFALGKSSKPQLATHNPVSSMRTEYMWENMNTKNQLQAQIDEQKAANAKLQSDLATTNANLAKFAADSDADGVPDFYDKCPNTPAGTKVDGSGCPLEKRVLVVTEEDKRVVRDAIANLEFDTGKATIRAKSYSSLDRVANLLVEKNFSLKLAGHTDNVGSDALNLKLSKDRAESIKSYLVSKGANPSRIEATGYGESQPIATNATAAGRQANRRVEFTLY